VVYEGPLAKAQRIQQVEGMERLNVFVATAAELKPEVIDNLDFDEEVRIAADILGVPVKVVRDRAEMQAMREARAEQQAQQAQMEMFREDAAAAGKAAPLLKALQVGNGREGRPGA